MTRRIPRVRWYSFTTRSWLQKESFIVCWQMSTYGSSAPHWQWRCMSVLVAHCSTMTLKSSDLFMWQCVGIDIKNLRNCIQNIFHSTKFFCALKVHTVCTFNAHFFLPTPFHLRTFVPTERANHSLLKVCLWNKKIRCVMVRRRLY